MTRVRRPHFVSALAMAGSLLMLTGCGGADVVDAGDVTVLVGEGSGDGMTALLPGRLAVVEGCLGLESQDVDAAHVVVWPHGTEVVDEDPLTISIPDDGEYEVCDELEVGGGASPLDEPGGIDVQAECPGAAIWLAHN